MLEWCNLNKHEEDFTAKTDLRPILDAVAATRIDYSKPSA
jgi:hypothetical protein